MPTPLADIVSLPELGLRMLTPESPSGERLDGSAAGLPEVNWAHGSDLHDPTPFLSPGHLLLTTGRQFEHYDADDYRGYVERLRTAGMVALGFGTEVVRQGTPPELVEACRESGLPLAEIPYRTPFIAVARAIADREAAAARARVDWALSVQDGIARAVGRGGLGAAVAVAAEALSAEVWVLDADAAVLEHAAAPAEAPALEQSAVPDLAVATTDRAAGARARASDAHPTREQVEAAALGLLTRNRRARSRQPLGDATLLLQTLGASGRQQGVVAVAHGDRLDTAAESVVGTLAALAELALEHADDLRVGQRSILEQLFQLLLDGRIDTVQRAAEVLRIRLPAEPFVVVTARLADVDPRFRDAVERRAAQQGGRLAVARGEHLHLLVDETAALDERGVFDDRDVAAGLSGPAGWSALDAAVRQSLRALDSASPGSSVVFGDLAGGTLLGLLADGPAAEVARARLAAVRGGTDGDGRLHAAEVWLRHNGRWEPAARELGMHRHSLKLRIEALGTELGLALDGFQGRAELWALLSAAGLGAEAR